MPILDNEIVWRPAALMSDTTPAQNGGRMGYAQLVSGVKNNLFPDVSQAERTAGSINGARPSSTLPAARMWPCSIPGCFSMR